jgi:hypothetical protein
MDGFKIVWSPLAQIELIEIMESYFHRNKSMKVSEDLSLKIYADIEKLSFNPLLGISSDMHNVRL